MKENQENEPVMGKSVLEQMELLDTEVVDAEVVTPEEPKKELTLEETKKAVAALRNIPYVKILNEEGDIINPINGNYPNYFSNRRQRKALIKNETKNPKNNKKGARVVITKTGALDFTKTHVKKQRVEYNLTDIYTDNGMVIGWDEHKARTIVHNQIKEN